MKIRFKYNGKFLYEEVGLVARQDGTTGPPYTLKIRHFPNSASNPAEVLSLIADHYDVEKDEYEYIVVDRATEH